MRYVRPFGEVNVFVETMLARNPARLAGRLLTGPDVALGMQGVQHTYEQRRERRQHASRSVLKAVVPMIARKQSAISFRIKCPPRVVGISSDPNKDTSK